MKFYDLIGSAALGSRLRRLAHIITNDAKDIYALYGVSLQPHWFPVFLMLTTQEKIDISTLAEQTGLVRTAVSKIVKEMEKSNLVSTYKCKSDARVTNVSLTSLGKEEAQKLKPQIADVSDSVTNLFLESGNDFWKSLNAIEQALERKGMYERVQDTLRERELNNIKLESFSECYAEDFRELNLAWIQEHWRPEQKDFEELNNPEEAILKKGGYIAIAKINDLVVGSCGLIKVEDQTYELVKMTVRSSFRKKGIGQKLAENAIKKAHSLGAKTILLECNSVLTPAISLYEKLGFKYIPLTSSPYQRCNVKMKMNLSHYHEIESH